jgi:N-acetylmuramoyl-L-alanine amidase-like protein
MKRILVQAGHKLPLQPGFEGQTGAQGEAQLVSDIQQALVRTLNADQNFHPIPMPGKLDDNLQVEGAIFLHADGFSNPSAHGYSFGFPLFDVNRRLAGLIGEEIEKLPGHPAHRADNATTDASQYYGFRHTHTPGPEVLVEHGFVTNPSEHAWLKAHVQQIAQAEHTALRRFFGFGPGHGPAHPADTPAGQITPDSALRAAPRARAEQAEHLLLARPHGEYTDADVRNIVGHYYDVAPAVGLDPLLVIAQMVEETGNLMSFWSQRPRRNPAGIGVTGQPGAGVSFPDWTTATRAHTGRLLAYSLPKGSENQAQANLIREALSFRPLPDALRGAARTLNGLVGTWAHDPHYAANVSNIANQIRGN